MPGVRVFNAFSEEQVTVVLKDISPHNDEAPVQLLHQIQQLRFKQQTMESNGVSFYQATHVFTRGLIGVWVSASAQQRRHFCLPFEQVAQGVAEHARGCAQLKAFRRGRCEACKKTKNQAYQ